MDDQPTHPNRSLRRLLIDPKFQLSLMAYFAGLSATTTATLYVALSRFFNKYYQEGAELKLPLTHPFYGFIKEQQHYMNALFISVAIISFLITLAFSIFISHRIVGPLLRLKGYFERFDPDHPQELRFRKRDYFRDLPVAINEALAKIRKN